MVPCLKLYLGPVEWGLAGMLSTNTFAYRYHAKEMLLINILISHEDIPNAKH